MPASVDSLRIHLGIEAGRPVDVLAMTAAVDAANGMVASLRRDLPAPGLVADEPPADGEAVEWPPAIDEAATLQAARLYGRRGSVQGVAAFAEAGVSLLAKMDPDVRVLLEVGEFQPSVIA